MNDETLAYLHGIILRLDNASGGIKFTSAEVRNLSYSLKHLVVNELRTEGKYLLATQKAVEYGIR